MSPDVGRAENLSGPSIVNSAGLPDVGAGTDVEVEVEGAGLLLDAQAAAKNATTTRAALLRCRDSVTVSSNRVKLAIGLIRAEATVLLTHALTQHSA